MASETTSPAPAPTAAEAADEVRPGGRYIPYSGGSAGWFENSGVLKSELRNNYGFRAEMDLPEVRTKQFLRWGPSFERRGGTPRKRRQLPIRLLSSGETRELTTFDINNRGIRLQFAEPPGMKVGDEFGVEVLDAPEGSMRIMLQAEVIWMDQASGTRDVWNVGLFFPEISADSAAQLTTLLEG